MSEPEIPFRKRQAWPAGFLLSIVQMLVWFFVLAFGPDGDSISRPMLVLPVVDLIAGILLWRREKFVYPGRVLVFAALFPVVLFAAAILVFGGICLLQGRRF